MCLHRLKAENAINQANASTGARGTVPFRSGDGRLLNRGPGYAGERGLLPHGVCHLYYLTGATPATRFAFTGLPHSDHPGRDGCSWAPQKVEMRRALDFRPRFIVVENGVVRRRARSGRESDYRLRKRYDQHYLHHCTRSGAPAELYELAGDERLSFLP